MKLDCVLTACDNNPLYYEFIPYFIKAWKKLYPLIDIKIIYINNEIPQKFDQYIDNIILFKPLSGVSTVLTSQVIRILYPAIMNYENAVLITDIDMIPMNGTFYSNVIEKYSSDNFIIYRDICSQFNEIAICYNAATPKIWSSIFSINSIDNIVLYLIELSKLHLYMEKNNKYNWSLDQRLLYDKILKWNGNVIKLNEKETKFNRLCRSHNFELTTTIKNNIKNEIYHDYHCKRPYIEYKNINDEILNLLPNKK